MCLLVLLSITSTLALAQKVESLVERRTEAVVLQSWDLSCGAAALATVLQFQHGDQVSEQEIATRMMSRAEYLSNPAIVTLRQGFSLLDIKRVAESLGYRGRGLGRLNINHLVARAPVIVPVDLRGYQHFVVFRGVLGDRVLLADPAYGNRTMSMAAFTSAWIEAGELGHVGFVVERRDNLIPPNRLDADPADFPILR